MVLWFLLLFQYVHNRSLWNDEASLSLNILDRTFSGLLRPLDYYQVAPVLFLLIEKLFITLFGNSELQLRIFPLLCAIVSLPVFYKLTLKLTGNPMISLCAMILLGCAPQFIYYSSEVKQYEADLLVMLVLYYIAFADSVFINRWRGLILSITGAIAIFLSNISVIALCTLGILYACRVWHSKKIKAEYWIPGMIWIIFFGINYFLFIRNHP
ncbi:MAG: glycosyltransferase family 39 protein, partial [Chitinophagaceae bacterium]|nr:glycosyltransferase family 39 protein [Chitinophagaceae bacterium]